MMKFSLKKLNLLKALKCNWRNQKRGLWKWWNFRRSNRIFWRHWKLRNFICRNQEWRIWKCWQRIPKNWFDALLFYRCYSFVWLILENDSDLISSRCWFDWVPIVVSLAKDCHSSIFYECPWFWHSWTVLF